MIYPVHQLSLPIFPITCGKPDKGMTLSVISVHVQK